MTDERIGPDLRAAVMALPPGAGIVFRHRSTDRTERQILFRRVARLARRRGLVLLCAQPLVSMNGLGGIHGRGPLPPGGIRTWPAHSRAEAVAGRRAGADALFVSPVYPTRSHGGQRAIGACHAARIGRGLGLPMIALGGMDARRFRRIRHLGFHGWAAIDAWLPAQKRRAVPI